MHPSADTSCTSSTKRHVVYILWILFKHHKSLEEKNLRHALKLKSFARDFKEALEIKLPGWNYDLFKWQRLFLSGVPTSIDG